MKEACNGREEGTNQYEFSGGYGDRKIYRGMELGECK
jgi:hypothetical protein